MAGLKIKALGMKEHLLRVGQEGWDGGGWRGVHFQASGCQCVAIMNEKKEKNLVAVFR